MVSLPFFFAFNLPRWDVPDVGSPENDTPFLGIPEACHQLRDGRFAGARWPHYGTNGSWLDDERDVLQNRGVTVGKPYVLEAICRIIQRNILLGAFQLGLF